MENNKYTLEELDALEKKFDIPEETVICPRCGRKLIFSKFNSSCEVKCETPGCLHDVIRGI